MFALGLSLVVGIVSIPLIAFKKIHWRQFQIMILPMLATFNLAFGLRPLIQFELNYLSFTDLNAVTLTIFFGTLFFGLFSFLGLWLLYSRWDILKSSWIKFPVSFATVGTAAVAGVFLIHGMIGTMIWSW